MDPIPAVLRTNFHHRAAEAGSAPYAKAPSTGPAPCKAGFPSCTPASARPAWHVAGGRTAAGAAVARGRDHVARIVLLRGGRRVAARRSHDHTSPSAAR